jgi:hypothetical protein
LLDVTCIKAAGAIVLAKSNMAEPEGACGFTPEALQKFCSIQKDDAEGLPYPQMAAVKPVLSTRRLVMRMTESIMV